MKNILIITALFFSITFGDDTSKVVKTHNNGKISIISYYQDTENGLELIKQETFHFSGPKSMVGNFTNGLRDGNWIYWHENGNKRLEGSYSNGFKNGLWIRWYQNGKIATKYIYDNTALNGKETEWHIDKECWDNIGNECECGSSWWDDCETH
tara:strand:- start:1730 stop:2188 length:459 start_codon:yes stop_codon:yes gene_type:complete